MAEPRKPVDGLVTEFAAYYPGDYAWRALVLQIERVVNAKQSTCDRVSRNNDGPAIAGKMHAAVDGTALERNGRRAARNSTWAGVADLDCPVDDATRTAYFFWADENIRGSVRDQPAIDDGAAHDQYPAGVDPHAARDRKSVV